MAKSNVMQMSTVCALALMAVLSLSGSAQADDPLPAIIPQPMEVQAQEGAFTITGYKEAFFVLFICGLIAFVATLCLKETLTKD